MSDSLLSLRYLSPLIEDKGTHHQEDFQTIPYHARTRLFYSNHTEHISLPSLIVNISRMLVMNSRIKLNHISRSYTSYTSRAWKPEEFVLVVLVMSLKYIKLLIDHFYIQLEGGTWAKGYELAAVLNAPVFAILPLFPSIFFC